MPDPIFPNGPIAKNPTAYVFQIQAGFRRVGELAMPSEPIGPPTACEPTDPAELGSWHRIKPPNQPDGVYIRARWEPTMKYWAPPLEQQGRRVAYSSAYLAAVGWTYLEAE
jgi:hypothetical protein